MKVNYFERHMTHLLLIIVNTYEGEPSRDNKVATVDLMVTDSSRRSSFLQCKIRLHKIDPMWSDSFPKLYIGENFVHRTTLIVNIYEYYFNFVLIYFKIVIWRINPEFEKIAVRILSQTTSSSDCERNWSTFSLIYTKVWNYLSYLCLEKMI